MGAFEYLLLFAAVILGLALSDLAISTHKLLNASARLRWDWLAPLAAILAFERIVTQWWSWYAAKALASGLTFAMFVGVLVSAVLLFLLAAAALPDQTEGEVLDLKVYYATISRRYWLLFAGQWALMNATSAWAQMRVLKAHLDLASPEYLILPVALALAFLRNRWVQTAGLVGFIAFYMTIYFGRTLA